MLNNEQGKESHRIKSSGGWVPKQTTGPAPSLMGSPRLAQTSHWELNWDEWWWRNLSPQLCMALHAHETVQCVGRHPALIFIELK